jgi:FMN phosphatase YigB (HAD superfamily)
MTKKYIICDLDGTLCDHSHRIYLAWSKNWHAYNSGCPLDRSNQSVLDFLMYNSHATDENCEIVFLTGRSENYEELTRGWLCAYFDYKHRYHLIMRKEGDYRKASAFKFEALGEFMASKEITADDIFAAIDDDETCCEMYRGIGIKNVIHYKGE